jgi:glutamyl-Q tRNA(Asp) synthetase
MTVTRFAPSPSGYLHLGHAHSALFAARAAPIAGGRFLLRIEDIDGPRSRPEFEAAIYEDLSWLGLRWETPVWRQSERMQVYREALGKLQALDLLYPCFCTRKEIQAEIARAGKAPHGPEGALYPGICRVLSEAERARLLAEGKDHCLRLDVAQACARTGPLTWLDLGAGEMEAKPQLLGDVVLARKDIATSYHLAVTVDDAAQGVSLVTRGKDLFHASHLHRLLQELLQLPVPGQAQRRFFIACASGARANTGGSSRACWFSG